MLPRPPNIYEVIQRQACFRLHHKFQSELLAELSHKKVHLQKLDFVSDFWGALQRFPLLCFAFLFWLS